ncbi:MAG: InlB B-repeat-containing protein [Clostridia bacterium]|nr:InlB B-repeat-containing protein [Clostridia bacterium]
MPWNYPAAPSPATYPITYNANGGTGAPAAQTKTQDATLILSATKPTRPGYMFQGWATSATATLPDYAAGASYTANAATTLYAVWQAVSGYTVQYDLSGGSGSGFLAQAKLHDGPLTLHSQTPTKSGYDFLGWQDANDENGIYAAGDVYTRNASTTMIAIWRDDGTHVYGDLDGDKQVTTRDTVLLCRKNVNLSVPDGLLLDKTDVNLDGKTNLIDIILMCRHIVGTVATLPMEASKVPPLIGLTESAAIGALTAEGFTYTTVELPNSDVEAGCVFAQDPAPNYIAAKGSNVKLSISVGGTWGTWTTDASMLNDPLYESQTKVQYSSRTKETASSQESVMEGWTKYDDGEEWSAYGDWGGWQDAAIASSDSVQVETRSVEAAVDLETFVARIYDNNGNLAWGWFRNETQMKNCGYECVGWSQQYSFSGISGGYQTVTGTSGEQGRRYATSFVPMESEVLFVTNTYYKTQYRACTRDLLHTYYFYRWSDWSAYGDSMIVPTESCEVRTQTLYRYRLR